MRAALGRAVERAIARAVGDRGLDRIEREDRDEGGGLAVVEVELFAREDAQLPSRGLGEFLRAAIVVAMDLELRPQIDVPRVDRIEQSDRSVVGAPPLPFAAVPVRGGV